MGVLPFNSNWRVGRWQVGRGGGNRGVRGRREGGVEEKVRSGGEEVEREEVYRGQGIELLLLEKVHTCYNLQCASRVCH